MRTLSINVAVFLVILVGFEMLGARSNSRFFQGIDLFAYVDGPLGGPGYDQYPG